MAGIFTLYGLTTRFLRCTLFAYRPVMLLPAFFLLAFTAAFAQGEDLQYDKPAQGDPQDDKPAQGDPQYAQPPQDSYEPPLTSPPFQVYESERTSCKQYWRYQGCTGYDVYGRFINTSNTLPFGYYAVAEYTWWPDNYRMEWNEEETGYRYKDGEKSAYYYTGWSYESRRKEETGYLYKDGEKSAYYKFYYDEEKNIIEKEVEGVQAIRIFLFLMAPLLGLTQQDIEENEYLKQLLE